MQSSYRVNLIGCATHPTSHTISYQAPAQFSNVFPMTRHPAPQQSKRIAPDATASQSVAMQDWDTLFTAVKARLTQIAQPVSAPEQLPTAPDAADAAEVERLRATVLDCVAALDYLHTTARDGFISRKRVKAGAK